MPELSRFFGIIVVMYYADHAPPHFHVRYNEHRAKISILDLQLLDGQLPKRVMSMVLEWGFLHREALQENWARMLASQPLLPVAPLE